MISGIVHQVQLVEITVNLTDGTYVGYEGTLSSNNRPEGEVTVHMSTADRAQWPLPQRGEVRVWYYSEPLCSC